MNWYKIAKKYGGNDISVSINKLWASKNKLEKVANDIEEGRLSYSRGKLPIVSKSLSIRGAFFVLDGHHRIVEDIINGHNSIMARWNEYYPFLDAGIGNEIPPDSIKIVDFIRQNSIKMDNINELV